MSQSVPEKSTEPSRFLRTLCIFSIAGVAFWLFRDVKFFFRYRSMEGVTNSEVFLFGIVLNLFVLAGVILMLRNRKTGFYIYVVSELSWFVVPFIIDSWGDTYFALFTPIAILVTFAFLVMYIVNLEKMR
jgi:hypothetical protein